MLLALIMHSIVAAVEVNRTASTTIIMISSSSYGFQKTNSKWSQTPGFYLLADIDFSCFVTFWVDGWLTSSARSMLSEVVLIGSYNLMLVSHASKEIPVT
jgi:hypothetical protein